jgi:hypothetical protein
MDTVFLSLTCRGEKIILFVRQNRHTCPLRRKSVYIGQGFFSRGFFQQLFSGIPADKERWLSLALHKYHIGRDKDGLAFLFFVKISCQFNFCGTNCGSFNLILYCPATFFVTYFYWRCAPCLRIRKKFKMLGSLSYQNSFLSVKATCLVGFLISFLEN